MNLPTLGLLLVAQGPGAPPQDEGGWVLLDTVAAQAGEGVVTLRSLDRFVSEKLDALVQQGRIKNQEEFRLASGQLSELGLRDLVTEELEAQGGQDMGLDRIEIDRMVSFQIQDERKRIGTAEYIDKLTQDGTDPLVDQETRTRTLYQFIWARSKLGMSGPGGTRPTRDRFIRPGELRQIYRVHRDGLIPSEIRIQTIEMPIAAAGSLATARDLLAEARARSQAGEDFGEFVDQYSSSGRETRGISEWLAPQQLGDTPWGRWAAKAVVDDFSPIFELPPGGSPETLLLIRMHARKDPDPPGFEEDQIQKNLREVFAARRDNRIMEYERGRLRQGAYMWLNPNLRGLGAAPGGEE